MTNTLPIVTLKLALVTSAAGSDVVPEWAGFMHPDRSDRTRALYVGKYKTLAERRAAALGALRPHRQGDHECGLNCKPRDGIHVCSPTER
jgi:hypothetical protein